MEIDHSFFCHNKTDVNFYIGGMDSAGLQPTGFSGPDKCHDSIESNMATQTQDNIIYYKLQQDIYDSLPEAHIV